MKPGPLVLLLLFLLWGCSHATPKLVQVFQQVTRVYDVPTQSWSSKLSVFVQGSSSDGNKVFERLNLINDQANLYFTLTRGQWSVIDRPGEYWVGGNGLSFPGGVPSGTWRVVLVTRDGQKMESKFDIGPQPPGTPPARTNKVTVKADPSAPGRFQVSGWTEDYLVWPRDARGTVLARTKTVGPSFSVSAGAQSFDLYSYDKNRGEGLLAGPFPVQAVAKPADR